MRIEHSLDIPVLPEVLWQLTTDVERWPEITPTTIRHVERLDDGPMRPGSRARISQPGQRPTVWTVEVAEPPREFRWSARVFGVRTTAIHVVEPTTEGCRNHLALELSGRGAGVMGRLLGRRLHQVLVTENECFRRAAAEAVAGRTA